MDLRRLLAPLANPALLDDEIVVLTPRPKCQDSLGDRFYRIPRFQRPYSLDRENVGEFWDDAILADDPDYLMGLSFCTAPRMMQISSLS